MFDKYFHKFSIITSLLLLLVFVFALSATTIFAQEPPAKPVLDEVNLFSGDNNFIVSDTLNPNEFIIGYQNADKDFTFKIARVTENKVSYEAETILRKNQSDKNLMFLKIIALNNRQFVIFYRFSNDSATRFNLGIISEGKITFSYDPQSYLSSFNSNKAREVSITKLSPNHFAVVTSQEYDTNYKGFISIGEVSENQVKFSSQEPFSGSQTNVKNPAVIALSERNMMLAWEGSDQNGPYGFLQYAEYYDGQLHFRSDRKKTFFEGSFDSLAATSLGNNKFLLGLKTYRNAPAGSMMIHIISGEYFENEIVIKDKAATSAHFSTLVNLNALGKNTFIFNFSKPNEKNKTYFKTGVLEKGNLLFSDEASVDKSMTNVSICKLSDYQFAVTFQGFQSKDEYTSANQSGSIVGKVSKPASPIITDGSPSLLKTITLGENKVLAAYTETDKNTKTNVGLLRVGKIQDGKVMFGTPAEFTRETTTALNLAALDDEKFALIYRSASRTRMVIGKINDDNISLGQPIDVRSDELLADLQIVQISKNQLLLGFRTESELNVLTTVQVANELPVISGKEVVIDSDKDQKDISYRQFSVANFGNKIVMTYNFQYEDEQGDYQDNYRLRSALVDETGNISLQKTVTLGRFQEADIKFLNDKIFAVAYRSQTEKNIGKLIIGDLGENNETHLGKPFTFSDKGTRPVSIGKVDEHNLVLFYGIGLGSPALPAEKVFGKVCQANLLEVSCGEAGLVFDGKVSLLGITSLNKENVVFSFLEVEKGVAESKVGQVNINLKSFFFNALSN